jgi:uncharacterized protein YjbJ (UPF0337 family)
MNRSMAANRWKLHWHDAILDAVEVMDWEIVEANWESIRAKVKARWGKLGDDQLDLISGNRYQLVDEIQQSYGIGKDEAELQVREWEARNDDWFEKTARRGRNDADALRH